MEIFNEIVKEREYQDQHWGGPDSDDKHDEADWLKYIKEYILADTDRTRGREWRVRLTKVAALAMASLEWLHRKRRAPRSQEDIYAEACGYTVIVKAGEEGGKVTLMTTIDASESFETRMMKTLAQAVNIMYILDTRKP